MNGYHHASGGVVFDDPANDPDYQLLRQWIAEGYQGPGIEVGDKPRDMVVSADGSTLYVANTGTLDVSVVDLHTLREARRIQVRSPVNALAWAGDRLVLATLGVARDTPRSTIPARRAPPRAHPEAEFTLFRDPRQAEAAAAAPRRQEPLGPYDDVDGTLQEKFRDITNDCRHP